MKTLRFIMVSVLVLTFMSAPLFAGGDAEEPAQEEQGATEERSITFWTTEEQPERMERQEEIAEDFFEETGIRVDVVPVTESAMGERVTAAFAAGELPDVIYHPLAYTLTWMNAGILDSLAATEVVEALDADTYSQGVLDLVDIGGEYAAVPADGWAQLLVYRQDLFEERGLDTPDSYESILEAVEEFHDPPEMFGFVAATDPGEIYMMQVFEHIALANGADVVDDDGNITMNTPEMREAFLFYRELVEASPPGDLFWQQSRDLYHDDRTPMIIWSPFILHGLAGLRDGVPVTMFDDPTSSELAGMTGFATNLSGPNNPDGAGWTDVRYFGITVDADIEAAQQFVQYKMDEAYLDTLEVAAVGKHPVRLGTSDEPNRFVDGWADLEIGEDRSGVMSDFYEEDVIQSIFDGLQTGTRWGFGRGYGEVTAVLYDTRIVAQILREFLDGEHTVDEALEILQSEVERLVE
ncbi:MAG: ABC transporter substrate-binding protein [Spirochaetaceae bacterium]